jgi:hypothetical protein
LEGRVSVDCDQGGSNAWHGRRTGAAGPFWRQAVVIAVGVAWWWPGQEVRKLPVRATLSIPGNLIFPLAFSPDGSTLVTGDVTNRDIAQFA